MSGKINLDVESICNRQFNIDFKGYNMDEVDAFLDMVIGDYESYQASVEELNDKIAELERTNASLRAKLIQVEGKTRALEIDYGSAGSQNVNNVDILKRLSRLEEEVFEQSRNKQ